MSENSCILMKLQKIVFTCKLKPSYQCISYQGVSLDGIIRSVYGQYKWWPTNGLPCSCLAMMCGFKPQKCWFFVILHQNLAKACKKAAPKCWSKSKTIERTSQSQKEMKKVWTVKWSFFAFLLLATTYDCNKCIACFSSFLIYYDANRF